MLHLTFTLEAPEIIALARRKRLRWIRWMYWPAGNTLKNKGLLNTTTHPSKSQN